MPSYFDPAKTEHAERLHYSVRNDDELGPVAARAERDVLRKLKDVQRVDEDGRRRRCAGNEYLNTSCGYPRDPTDADAPEGDELEDLLDVIADVTSHRLRYLDEDPTLTQERRGKREIERDGASLDPEWPKQWRKPLAPWIEDLWSY